MCNIYTYLLIYELCDYLFDPPKHGGDTVSFPPLLSHCSGVFACSEIRICIPSERASQEEQNGANFSFKAPSSEE